MATTVDKLIVEIKAETAGLRKGLDSVNQKLKTTNKTAKASIMTFGNLTKVFAVIGFARIGKEIVNTSRQFEDLEATLKAITGSAEGAALSMDMVREFTKGTTFQLQNVSSAFTTLLNAGIAPTSDTLKDFGNLAAAFGKDITQIAQATFNATTGETEMLKQFGIKAKLEGDKITMIFREQETTIGRNSEEIVGFLRNIAQENFDTALEERLNTVSGVFSNLLDGVAELFNAIGESGLNDVLKRTGKRLIQLAQAAEPLGAMIGEGIGKAFNLLGKTLRVVQANMNTLMLLMTLFAARQAAIGATLLFSKAMVGLAKAIGMARTALLLMSRSPVFAALILGTVALGTFTDKVDKLAAQATELAKAFGLKMGFFEPENLDATTKSIDEMNAEIEAMVAGMSSGLDPALNGTEIALGDMREAVITSSNAFTTDFVDSLLQGKNALESFKNFSRSIVSQIIAIFLQMAVVNKILNAVFNLQGANRLGEINLSNPDVDNLADGIGFAGGGTVQAGRPTVVGERGAEIFIPNTGGSIMNNMNSKNAMGGGATIINQSINFATGVVPTVRAEVMKMMPQIADVTKGAVAEAAMRGGNYRRALQGG
tara:strand:- start:1092 stop:2888 length:1797 start_codon:yes stop_codon:yes gene_type:complete